MAVEISTNGYYLKIHDTTEDIRYDRLIVDVFVYRDNSDTNVYHFFDRLTGVEYFDGDVTTFVDKDSNPFTAESFEQFYGTLTPGSVPIVQASNVVTVNAKTDLPAPVGGVITTNGKVYAIGAHVDLTGDRIQLSDDAVFMTFGIAGASLTSTGLTGVLIKGTDCALTLDNIPLKCPSGTILDINDTTNSKELIIHNSSLTDCNKVMNLGYMYDIHIDGITHFAKFNSGINVTADLRHLHLRAFIRHSRNSGTGATTFLNWGAFKCDFFEFIGTNITSVQADDIAIDVSGVDPKTFGTAIIKGSNFINYTANPLVGANAATDNWNIPYLSNEGLTGLLEVTLPIANQTHSTTAKYATYSLTNQSVYIDLPSELNPGADRIDAQLVVEEKISDGSTWWADLYNYTDGQFIEDPPGTYPFEFSFNATAADQYEKAASAWYELTGGKSYGATITGAAGGGNRTTTLLNAQLKIRVYKL